MTILEAINKDPMLVGRHPQSEVIRWLSELDGMVKSNIINTHEGGDGENLKPYTEDDMLKTLLIPFPYDGAYEYWLSAKDYATTDTKRYANAMNMFNSVYTAFERAYNRKHMPIGKKLKFS